MAQASQLFGSCACERNQYTVTIPPACSWQASVFFDNSAANRRYQAAPLTAWLRIPLDWFASTTYAHFPDETHHSIRRTFYSSPSSYRASSSLSSAPSPSTRRQFCGYCGTHLTAWNESRGVGAGDALDVTLGSLAVESLEVLRGLEVLPDEDEDLQEEEEERGFSNGGGVSLQQKGTEPGLMKGGSVDDDVHVPTVSMAEDEDDLVKGGSIDDEDHIPTAAQQQPGEGPAGAVIGGAAPILSTTTTATIPATSSRNRAARRSLHQMQHRGMPFFEEMVENSPLGRIRRQRGGQSSADGSRTEEWEIVEIDGGAAAPGVNAAGELDADGNTVMSDVSNAAAAAATAAVGSNKRLKTTR